MIRIAKICRYPVWKISAYAAPDSAPSLAIETMIKGGKINN